MKGFWRFLWQYIYRYNLKGWHSDLWDELCDKNTNSQIFSKLPKELTWYFPYLARSKVCTEIDLITLF